MNWTIKSSYVATVLTVYGIETIDNLYTARSTNIVATVLTVYGIETMNKVVLMFVLFIVATVLTVYGIETKDFFKSLSSSDSCNSTYRLRY